MQTRTTVSSFISAPLFMPFCTKRLTHEGKLKSNDYLTQGTVLTCKQQNSNSIQHTATMTQQSSSWRLLLIAPLIADCLLVCCAAWDSASPIVRIPHCWSSQRPDKPNVNTQAFLPVINDATSQQEGSGFKIHWSRAVCMLCMHLSKSLEPRIACFAMRQYFNLVVVFLFYHYYFFNS